MRKNVLPVFCLLLCLASLPAASASSLSFSVEAFSGMKYGQVDELVLYDNDDQLSRLEWEQHYSPFIGIAVRGDIDTVFLKASASGAFPYRSGIIEDFDYRLDDHSIITDYSAHNAYLDTDFILSAELGAEIPVHKTVNIVPVFGFTYQNRMWRAVGGYGQYEGTTDNPQPWTENTPVTPFAGTVMSYQQTIWYPSVGAQIELLPENRFSFGLAGYWYPFMSVTAVDHHFVTGMRYKDTMTGQGWRVEVSAMLDSVLNAGKGNLKLTAGYEAFSLRGNTATGYIGEANDVWSSAFSSSGTQSSLFSVRLGFSY